MDTTGTVGVWLEVERICNLNKHKKCLCYRPMVLCGPV